MSTTPKKESVFIELWDRTRIDFTRQGNKVCIEGGPFSLIPATIHTNNKNTVISFGKTSFDVFQKELNAKTVSFSGIRNPEEKMLQLKHIFRNEPEQ